MVDAGAIQEISEKYSKEIAEQDTEQAALGAQYKGKTYAFPYGIEHKLLTTTSLSLMKKMLNHMKQSLKKLILM